MSKLLLVQGAHLDTPDVRDITPHDILKTHAAKINLVPYVSLKCLATEVILRERIQFDQCEVPPHLNELIEMHVRNLPANLDEEEEAAIAMAMEVDEEPAAGFDDIDLNPAYFHH